MRLATFTPDPVGSGWVDVDVHAAYDTYFGSEHRDCTVARCLLEVNAETGQPDAGPYSRLDLA